MHGVEAQQVGVGLDRAEIVDGDDFNVGALGLVNRPQHVAANAAKPVNRDPDCHILLPKSCCHPRRKCFPRRF